jgi:tetratricopeptide (TPR) repeat protein
MTRRVGVWAFLVALTATTATVPPGWSEEPARGAPRAKQAPTAEELAAAREARFRTVWSAADAPHQAGDYAESERLYKQVLAEFPDAQRAALRVAIAQERQGKSAEALESYDRALAADPQGEWAPVALFYKARFCKEDAREPDARAALRALDAEGHILTRNRRFDEAEAAFMRILDVCPDDSPRIMQVARTRLAALAHARGDGSSGNTVESEVAGGQGVGKASCGVWWSEGCGSRLEVGWWAVASQGRAEARLRGERPV